MTMEPTSLITTALLVLALLAIMAGRYRGVEQWRMAGMFLLVLVLMSSFLSESLACGNCSAGFCCAAGWWIWRHGRPSWAFASLILGVVAGLWLGLSDVLALRHPASVVVGSAVLTFGLAHTLYLYFRALSPPDVGPVRARKVPGLGLWLLLIVVAAALRAPETDAVAGHARLALTDSPSMSANSAPVR